MAPVDGVRLVVAHLAGAGRLVPEDQGRRPAFVMAKPRMLVRAADADMRDADQRRALAAVGPAVLEDEIEQLYLQRG